MKYRLLEVQEKWNVLRYVHVWLTKVFEEKIQSKIVFVIGIDLLLVFITTVYMLLLFLRYYLYSVIYKPNMY